MGRVRHIKRKDGGGGGGKGKSAGIQKQMEDILSQHAVYREDELHGGDGLKQSWADIDKLIGKFEAKRQRKKGKHWLLTALAGEHEGTGKWSQAGWFHLMVISAISLNTITMGLEVDLEHMKDFFFAIDVCFLAVFLFEMLVKMHDERLGYFKESWNLLDFCLVMSSLVNTCIIYPIYGNDGAARKSSMLRVLRLFRTVRMARVLRVFKEMVVILKGMANSLPTIGWVCLLLGIMLYIGAIFCSMTIGTEDYPARDEHKSGYMNMEWNNFRYFGTVFRSMYTLFNIVILAEWPEIGRPLFEEQTYMLLFFFGFITLTTFGLANVIIGVIVDNTMTAAQTVNAQAMDEVALENMENLKFLHDLLFSVEDGVAKVSQFTYESFLEVWKKDDDFAKVVMDLVDLPRLCTANEAFDMLNRKGENIVSAADFMLHTMRLYDHDTLQQHILTLISIHRMEQRISRAIDELDVLSHRVGPPRRAVAKPADDSTGQLEGEASSSAGFEELVSKAISQMIEDRMLKVEEGISLRIEKVLRNAMLPASFMDSSPEIDADSQLSSVVQGAMEKQLVRMERVEESIESQLSSMSSMTIMEEPPSKRQLMEQRRNGLTPPAAPQAAAAADAAAYFPGDAVADPPRIGALKPERPAAASGDNGPELGPSVGEDTVDSSPLQSESAAMMMTDATNSPRYSPSASGDEDKPLVVEMTVEHACEQPETEPQCNGDRRQCTKAECTLCGSRPCRDDPEWRSRYVCGI
eukprot:gnl/TRDRNA2_/TRDRNA2_136055_c0_seq2.p1 gnl/TRDRNA2_/TRDRNA2_136055_c0~~gnl/TRDRNA2_/TRDRNA2_136055_c0_seq2.p1  ORF type:complete len:749 (+),score=132.20 gnl/TRDRNA2_/TRDRNA2_136055_c0_seq2:98-2344(+)